MIIKKRSKIALILILIINIFFITIFLNGDDEDNRKVMNLGALINSSGAEFFPSISLDGKTMIFNLRPLGETKSDIYISKNIKGKWSKPKKFDVLNSIANDETPYISSDGKMIVFSSNREGSLKPKVINNVQFITTDLYYSKFEDRKWSKPEKLKGKVNTVDNERAPSLSRDKKTLYFSRWDFDNIHKSRIMQATLIDGEYKNIKPLPYPINTEYSDYGLIPSSKKPGFFFSSDRPGGFGLWDIYFAFVEGEKITEVINLGSKTNSKNNELSITEIGKNTIYFCSNKEGGHGEFDIYSIILPPKIQKKPKTGFIFKTVNEETMESISIKFKISQSKEYGKNKKSLRSEFLNSDNEGYLKLKLLEDAKWVTLTQLNNKYEPFHYTYSVSKGRIKTIIVEIKKKVKKKVKKAPKFQFKPIYFGINSSKINSRYIPYIHSILYYLRKFKNVKLQITGHTDLHGEYNFNNELSIKRATRVRDYFISLGVNEDRFIIIGKGFQSPEIDSRGRGDDDLNRRVLFKSIME